MYIVFDIGGSHMRFAKSTDLESISEPVIKETPQDYKEGLSLIKEIVDGIAGSEEIEGIAGGIAGTFNEEKTKLVFSPNMTDWVDQTIFDDFEGLFDVRPIIHNDAAVAGLGEAHFGAGQDSKVMVYMTYSTGVGGSLIIDKKIPKYNFGYEPGHQILNTSTLETLHDYGAGNFIKKRLGMSPEELKDEGEWREIVRHLAIGLHNSILHWSPDTVIVNGGLMQAISIDDLKIQLKKVMTTFPNIPEVKLAALHNCCSGLYGGVALLKEE